MRRSIPLLFFALLLAGEGAAQVSLGDVDFRQVATGFSFPVGISNAADGSGRLFIVERSGRIWALDRNFERPSEPLLDIRDRVATSQSFTDERGLYSVAFPPDFATSRRFFVNYNADSGSVISSFLVTAQNSDRADPASEEIYLTQPQPFSNHNGGDMHFGPDGYLYVGFGDGGSGDDPGNRAQDLSTWLGKMLRLDVSQGAPARAAPSNPLAGQAGARPEIWAYGLRNPWRFSFDRGTGDLLIGDVGQGQREEIDFQPAGMGGANYGWRRMEGARCNIPDTGCDDGSLTPPILEYTHASGGCSVTGGYVYRGAAYPALDGLYIFADFCQAALYAGSFEGGAWRLLGPRPVGIEISAFGEDEGGEIYFANLRNGAIYRIEGPQPTPTVSENGVVNAASFLAGSVAPGSIASVFGVGLAVETASADATPLPTTLGGGSLTLGGAPVPLFFASSGQMNVYIPRELEGLRGAQLITTRDGVEGQATSVDLTPFAPGIFTLDQSGAGQGAVLIAGTGLLAAPADGPPHGRPARIGEALEIFATGLGAVSADAAGLQATVQQPTVRIGDAEPARVLFSGLAPGFVGLYQVNVELVGDFPSGSAVPLQIFQGEAASNEVTIAIE
ncbi:MAG: hypothetical protein GC160_25145 [Acidobacteria bacterium]|nr:hypothetical protein [Acidobacteriota bacterium]